MSDDRYHLAARLVHWIMAAGFVFMWGCGYAMTTLVEDDSPLEELLFDLHISVGVTLLALLVARIAIRMIHRPPPLPEAIRGVERTAAHLGHAALYALPALVIAVGWAQIDFGGHGVQWFGVEMPGVFPETGEGPRGPRRGRAQVARLRDAGGRRRPRRGGLQASLARRPRRHPPHDLRHQVGGGDYGASEGGRRIGDVHGALPQTAGRLRVSTRQAARLRTPPRCLL